MREDKLLHKVFIREYLGANTIYWIESKTYDKYSYYTYSLEAYTINRNVLTDHHVEAALLSKSEYSYAHLLKENIKTYQEFLNEVKIYKSNLIFK